ncbi:paraneoplastic Ma antigen 1 [Chelydra serpentina]|uniref:Paraneoplastic Ma antigen 1 n=1 Tax=Chelydra serpentina TaxID=8475 RepID=A0A8T1SXT5_CHESE|nr:paraneoplastic Ma antigen 1 [Chelydra serpentina]
MLQEWALPDAEKRSCLVETLRGPALDMLCTLKLTNPGVSVNNCLEALEHTFRSSEGSEDIYCKFFNSCQEKGEKVSAYIVRLDRLLQRGVKRGVSFCGSSDLLSKWIRPDWLKFKNPILLHLLLRE